MTKMGSACVLLRAKQEADLENFCAVQNWACLLITQLNDGLRGLVWGRSAGRVGLEIQVFFGVKAIGTLLGCFPDSPLMGDGYQTGCLACATECVPLTV